MANGVGKRFVKGGRAMAGRRNVSADFLCSRFYVGGPKSLRAMLVYEI